MKTLIIKPFARFDAFIEDKMSVYSPLAAFAVFILSVIGLIAICESFLTIWFWDDIGGHIGLQTIMSLALLPLYVAMFIVMGHAWDRGGEAFDERAIGGRK